MPYHVYFRIYQGERKRFFQPNKMGCYRPRNIVGAKTVVLAPKRRIFEIVGKNG